MDCTSELPLLQVGIKKKCDSQPPCRHYHHILEILGVGSVSGPDTCLSDSIYLQFFIWEVGGGIQLLGLCKEQLNWVMLL